MTSGLKPGQRKVLYTCFKRNDKKDIKVAQLAGSVAEHSAYHHGEVTVTPYPAMSECVNLDCVTSTSTLHMWLCRHNYAEQFC